MSAHQADPNIKDPSGLDQPMMACTICTRPTVMLGTGLCDRCWELEGRISNDRRLACRILLGVDFPNPAGALRQIHRVLYASRHKFDTELKRKLTPPEVNRMLSDCLLGLDAAVKQVNEPYAR